MDVEYKLGFAKLHKPINPGNLSSLPQNCNALILLTFNPKGKVFGRTSTSVGLRPHVNQPEAQH